jgi:hypothetical protein
MSHNINKSLVVGLVFSFGLILIGGMSVANASANKKMHFMSQKFDLEMSGYEYRDILKQNDLGPASKKSVKNVFKSIGDGEQDKTEQPDAEDLVLDQYLLLGQRNLQWIDLVNSQRTKENEISLSSAATQQGYPISAPRAMNFKIVKESWDILKALLPAPLKAVIFEGAPLSEKVPVTDREFTEWLWQVDRAYQLAARYKMMKPYKKEMAEIAAYDVRGYLLLSEDAEIDSKLAAWAELSTATQRSLATSLEQICRNSETDRIACSQEFNQALTTKDILAYKNKYMPAAKANYDSFFQIPKARTDGRWSDKTGNILTLPFADPHDARVVDFLKFNIEDEFRWADWRLQLEFIETDSKDTTHIVFEAGSTPHVDELAGSVITMDANAPLSEYDVQWTIRHEYGHVLGLPDCYIEFYDEDVDAIVSYQLDVTNLMCSRRGHFQQTHFDELKLNYYK